jgi:hypothetical protein
MKITLSKAQWQEIGKKAGWIPNPPRAPKMDRAVLIEEIRKYNPQDIINAFKKMGDSTMSQLNEDEIKNEIGMCEEWELIDVLSVLKKEQKEIKQENKEFSQFGLNQLFRGDD